MPGHSSVRTRQLAVVVAAAAALVAGAAVGAGDDGRSGDAPNPSAGAAAVRIAGAEPQDLAAARALPLSRQAGALVVLRFAGTQPPRYVRRAMRRGRATGVILFRDNVTTPQALRRMTRRLQRAAGRHPVLVSVDQEGGEVRRIPFSGPVAGQPALGTPERAGAVARAGARQLAGFGINLNLAPVADVATVPGSVVERRAFPGGTAAVSRITRAAVAGYRGTGVLPALKHFPGIGSTTSNTDDRPATIRRTARELGAIDLPPFRSGIAAGAPVVMTSHALYPALDPNRIASQSPAVHRLLRGPLGFKGLVVTDSLEAAAVRARGGHERAAVRSVAAGADLLLTTGRGSYLDVLRAVIAEARRSPAFRGRVVDSAARVLAVRRRLGSRRAG